jgi:hypothetical protein
VDNDGVLYEKDLGKKTETTAKAMKEYNPNGGWHKAEEDTEETSSGDTTK